MKYNFRFIIILFLCALIPNPILAQAPVSKTATLAGGKILKIATLAPEGTTMAKSIHTMCNEIKTKTNGTVSCQVYFGGSAGDEKDVVRKMRIGQLQGAALTGVGLGMIEPEIRVLELPFLFKSYNQADYIYKNMESYFTDKFRQKGFELLAWAEVGFVNPFSNKPITKKSDMNGMKMWMWEGDPLSQAFFEAIHVVPVPLSLPDVLTSLQTGLIDGCYATPLAAIAFQWHTKAKYVTRVNLVNATGGLILAKEAWAKLLVNEQKIVRDVLGTQAKQLIANTRQENNQSLEVLKTAGLQIVDVTPEGLAELEEASLTVQKNLVGKLYSQALLDKVKQLITQAPQ